MSAENLPAEKKVPRWTDCTDRSWPVEVVPAWAYDGLKRENEALKREIQQLRKGVVDAMVERR